MDKVIIRPAAPQDVDAIAQLWLALVGYHREIDPDLPPAAPNGALRYARRLVDRLEDPMTSVLVAETEGKVVGYVLGMVVDLAPEMFAQSPSGFLADIYVDTAYRRHGVGRALVEHLSAWFRDKGLRYFEWHVAALNDDAVEFWRKVGGRDVMLRMRGEL
ncbi:MAG: GNAT family N-acetyltransferase [Anaerolineae bacterium]|uniref:GNAT family N-acetyltransferase n=1 Tax=Candidatus Flexifilum breve TaxID=3140694 RepID=UPI001AC853B9|nr:GNAT family N-acetyltransferase [Chloroflexota bacterium]MBK9751461.1 GNAT family N-acetyltransferase [Chloroflexota bacterium]MBN8635433.1 GNAT family N-acetyltransferase [Anaerolineae bacterium]